MPLDSYQGKLPASIAILCATLSLALLVLVQLRIKQQIAKTFIAAAIIGCVVLVVLFFIALLPLPLPSL
jgi:hypothetical protein